MIGEEQCCGRFCDVPNSPLCTCDKQTQSNAPLILEDLVAGDYLTESMKMLMIEQRNEVKRLQERLDWILGDEELAAYVWEKEVAYMEWEGVRLPWISADEWGEEE